LTTTPPVGLTKDAREAWQLAITCAPRGVLTALDATVLERWARNYATYRKIAKKLDNEDMVLTSETGVTLNPLFNALIKIQQVLSACEKELGFTPVSRARVKADVKEEEVNDFGDF
jgi:P27 family predicted phage terminase small subunit